jgi:hypothetical protein
MYKANAVTVLIENIMRITGRGTQMNMGLKPCRRLGIPYSHKVLIFSET